MKNSIWRTSGGNNARQGQAASLFSSSPQLSLKVNASAGITASPVFTASGDCLLADMAGQVQFLTSEGKPKWQWTLTSGIQATPVIQDDDSHAFVACFNGIVYALDLKNGESVWQIEIPSQFDARILSDLLYLPQNDLLLLSSWGYQYSAIDTKKVSVKYTWEAGSNLYAGATATHDETVYLLRAKWAREKSHQAVELLQIDPKTGKAAIIDTVPPEKKSVNFMKIASTPILSADESILYFAVNIDDYCHLMAYARKEQKILWQKTIKRHLLTTPALCPNGSLAITDMNGAVQFIEPSKGETIHTYNSDTYYILSSPICDNEGIVFFGDIEGKIHAVQPDGKGTVVYETGRCIQGRPAFDPDGRLVVPSMDRTVYRFA